MARVRRRGEELHPAHDLLTVHHLWSPPDRRARARETTEHRLGNHALRHDGNLKLWRRNVPRHLHHAWGVCHRYTLTSSVGPL